jgi:hypothetical protein
MSCSASGTARKTELWVSRPDLKEQSDSLRMTNVIESSEEVRAHHESKSGKVEG